MRVLWLCNIMPPLAAEQLHMEATNKEGWISGLANVMLEKREENKIELAIAFPAPEELLSGDRDVFGKTIPVKGGELICYGFREDTTRPVRYDEDLEERLKYIINSFRPDIVHCFGTEYPHTLAMCRVFPQKDRLLLGIQGLCTVLAEAYFASIPDQVVDRATFRDRLRRDSLREQQSKFVSRGIMEREAVKIAGNITGRTGLDRFYAEEWNKNTRYYEMNEILRPEFYGMKWDRNHCEEHSIFLSQGDYPLKGLHYVLTALPVIRKKYPDAKVYVAGQDLTRYDTLKQKLKLSGYGKYLRGLIREMGIENQVIFLGKLDSSRMRNQYLKCGLFVCPSSMENSPNSLGEAMLLGMPCVSADVGGIPSIFSDGEDGILYGGFRNSSIRFYGVKKQFDNAGDLNGEQDGQLQSISERLADAVMRMWSDPAKMDEYCRNARNHAERTHDPCRNYSRMLEIYSEIMAQK